MKTINPEYSPHRALGEDDAQWDALKDIITAYLVTHATEATVPTEDLRALDPKFRDDRIWAQICSDLDLESVP